MVDNKNVESKVFISNFNDEDVLKSLDLLVALKFGKKGNLKKNLTRCKGFINVLNNLLSKKESQRQIRGFVSDEELKMLDWMLSDPKKRKIEAGSLQHLILEDENNERRGIKNFKGVSCYCSALLQVLFNLKKIVELLSNSHESNNEWLGIIQSIWKKVVENKIQPADIEEEFNKIWKFPSMKGFRAYDKTNKTVSPIQGDLLEFLQILLQNLPDNFAKLFDVSNNVLISTVTTFMVDEFSTNNFDETCWKKILDNGFDVNDPLPEYLLIECNRIKGDNQKDKKAVKFYEVITVNNQLYQLNSTIVHKGEYKEGGHYIAYTRNKHTVNYIEYNDSVLTKMSFTDVLKKCEEELYMLVYEKIFNPAPKHEENPHEYEAMEIDSNEIQEIFTSDCFKVTKKDIYEILRSNGRREGAKECISLIQTKYSRKFSENGIKVMTLKFEKLKRDIDGVVNKLPKSKRYIGNILNIMHISETEEFTFPHDLFELAEKNIHDQLSIKVDVESSSLDERDKKPGRKSKTDFDELGRSKRFDFVKKKAESVQTSKAALEVLLRLAKNERKFALVGILKKIIEYDKKNETEKLLKLLEQKPVEKMSPARAYMFKLENNLSIRTYNRIRRIVNKYDADVFPSYKSMLAFQTSRMPTTLKFDDKSASISVKELNEITINSLLILISDDLSKILKEEKIEKNEKLKIIVRFIWGLDGSTQQRIYNQKGTFGEKIDDSSLMISSLAPVEMIISREDGSKLCRWRNPAPGSRSYNRTIVMRYEKESNDSILKMYNEVNEQIKQIQGKIVESINLNNIEGQNAEVVPFFYLTMIDGKVCTVLTRTKSFAQCPVCNAKPLDMNKIENLTNGKFMMQEKAIKHTVSPLHSVINFVRALFNIACRKNINSWRVPQNKRETFKSNRLRYKQALWDHFGVHFDEPRQGGTASSTTGSVCRKLLKDPKKLAEVLELDFTLVERLGIILKALNCKEEIDGEKFGKYALDTYKIFIQNYPWFYMPCTMHKVLAHGGEIIKSSPLPVGMMTEEGAEAKNKLFRTFREFLARKMDRRKTNEDVFVRMLFLSDPYLATLINIESPYYMNKDKLPKNIQMLLKNSENPGTQDENDGGDDVIPRIPIFYEDEDVLEELENYEQDDRDFDEDGEYENMVRTMALYNDNIDYTRKPRFVK